MKKSLFLATIIGLLPLTPSAWGGELVWNEDKTVNWAGKNWNPTIWGGDRDKMPEWVELSQPKDFEFTKNKLLIINDDLDLSGICMWNNVLHSITDDEGKTYVEYNPQISPTEDGAYTYGGLLIKSGRNVSLSEYTGTNSLDKKYTSVGTLALEAGSKLTITDRKLTVTGLPYTALGSGAVIKLSAATKSTDPISGKEVTTPGGVLSMGASDGLDWNAVVVSGANGEDGIISNKSEADAVLGTESAKHVEYSNVRIDVQGQEKQTEIVAKLGNATINNCTQGGEVVVSGGKVEGASIAVSQVSTGTATGESKNHGNVTMLNRGTEVLKMDSIYLGGDTTLASYEGARGGNASTIELNSFDRDLNARIEIESGIGSYGLIFEEGATLDANLILGAGNTEEAVVFGSWSLEETAYMAKDSSSMGLKMDGNNVTLRQGIALMAWFDEAPTAPSEILLFSNVNQLTLDGRDTFDNEYFTYDAGISAAEYFSTTLTDGETLNDYHLSLAEPDADGKGWYIEYRAIGDGETGNVYLAYMVPEPTTATLSLLALAGLAARRRRK